MANGPLTPAQLEAYDRDGYVLAKRFFTPEETALLKRAAKEDRVLDDHAFSRGDGAGGQVRLSRWNHPGDSIYGMFARFEPVINTAETILGGEVYHYHSKMILNLKTAVGVPLSPFRHCLQAVATKSVVTGRVKCQPPDLG